MLPVNAHTIPRRGNIGSGDDGNDGDDGDDGGR